MFRPQHTDCVENWIVNSGLLCPFCPPADHTQTHCSPDGSTFQFFRGCSYCLRRLLLYQFVPGDVLHVSRPCPLLSSHGGTSQRHVAPYRQHHIWGSCKCQTKGPAPNAKARALIWGEVHSCLNLCFNPGLCPNFLSVSTILVFSICLAQCVGTRYQG